MPNTERFSSEDISIIQTRQLRKTLQYTYNRSPFYRDLLDRAHMAPTEIKSMDDLSRLPTLSREILSQETPRFLCIRPEEVMEYVWSTQEPDWVCGLMRSETDLARGGYDAQLSLATAGVTPKDTVGLLLSLDRCLGDGLQLFAGLRRMGVPILRLGALRDELLTRMLRQMPVQVLVGTTQQLYRLARLAEEQGLDLPTLGIKLIIGLGEHLAQQDSTRSPIAEKITKIFGAPVRSWYYQAETSTTACECEKENGRHIHPEMAFIEILNDDQEPMAPGELGELCVTSFGITGMPLIRFRTGEISKIIPGICSCGRETQRIGQIIGYKKNETQLDGYNLDKFLMTHLKWKNYYIERLLSKPNGEQLIIWVENLSDVDVKILREMLVKQFSIKIDIRILPAEFSVGMNWEPNFMLANPLFHRTT